MTKRIFIFQALLLILAVPLGTWAQKETPTPGKLSKYREEVLIPAGSFWMGSPDKKGQNSEHPRHKVYLDAFYIAKYPVTNRLFREFVKATAYVTEAEKNGTGGLIWDESEGGYEFNPHATWKDPEGDGKGIQGRMNDPVVQVSWYDALAYAKWARKRLPTEAEYEKATRGDTKTTYFWGSEPGPMGEYVWYSKNSDEKIHPVGLKKPNPYGLYDILGDVDEWCSDWYEEQGGYYGHSPYKNPRGPKGQPGVDSIKAKRGGSCFTGFPGKIYSAFRGGSFPDNPSDDIGFRCVRNP